MYEDICKNCGALYAPPGPVRGFCSEECAREYDRALETLPDQPMHVPPEPIEEA